VHLVGVLLLALALRGLIPVGYMPAADGSLSLMICPDGFPAWLLPAGKTGAMPAGMGMPGGMAHSGPGRSGHGAMVGDHCIFCTGFSAAPPALLPAAFFLLVAVIAVVTVTVAPPIGIRLVHLPRARAPPAPR
jgi:Protein of unknown function (DUF2946)